MLNVTAVDGKTTLNKLLGNQIHWYKGNANPITDGKVNFEGEDEFFRKDTEPKDTKKWKPFGKGMGKARIGNKIFRARWGSIAKLGD